MAKAGYFGSNPEAIYNAPVEVVIDLYHYENFANVYEETYYELNKTK